MAMSKPFAGKLALVTGASRGIGAATAQALASGGRACHPVTARPRAALEEVEEGSTQPAAARPSRRWT